MIAVSQGGRRWLTMLWTIALLLASPAWADPLATARAPGTILLMRQTLPPGVGEAGGFGVADCPPPSRADDTGQDLARRMGNRLITAKIRPDIVATGPGCAAQETAALMGFRKATPWAELFSLLRDRNRAPTQSAALLARLSALPPETRVLLISHQVNIAALTGITPANGEVIVGRLRNGALVVQDRLRLK